MAATPTSVERHLASCRRFSVAVRAADERWDRPSPCTEWDARAVLEHVIGFHDVLLLRPLDAKPHRPRDDPAERWRVTFEAIADVLARPGLLEGPVDIPAVGNNPPSQLDAASLLPALTQDVLVHAWDLAKAVSADDRLDEGLCDFCLRRLPKDPRELVRTGVYGEPVKVAAGAGPQTTLLTRLGRDPGWISPSHSGTATQQ